LAIVIDGYCRVSTDPQEDGTSLDEQERSIRRYCADNGFVVGMVHRETFTGYQYRERKKLTLMRDRYRNGEIQGVVVRTVDRLSRKQTHTAILMEEMEHHHIEFHCVMEPVNTDDKLMDQFVRSVLAFVAEMEREKIMDRMITGKVSKANNGKVVSGNKALYGWKWVHRREGDRIVRDHLELDEEQAAVLRQAGAEYASGVSLHQIIDRLHEEGVPAPKGQRWYRHTLRHILTDPRMTGKNVQIFTVKNKHAKRHLEAIDLPDGTYPAILDEETYNKIVRRANLNESLATRNSKYPEEFLLRAGFARCAYCQQTMMASHVTSRGEDWFMYSCPNRNGTCQRFYVPAHKLDAAVWEVMDQLADHVALMEESIQLAIKNHSVEDDLRAVSAALDEWKQKVANYEDDLQDSSLRGDTRAGIRHMLNAAHEMVSQLKEQQHQLEVHAIDRSKVNEEYEKILNWCKKLKEEREALTYTQKRDFLSILGATVLVYKQEYKGAEPKWDIRVALPKVQEVIYQRVAEGSLGNDLSIDMSERAFLLRFSWRNLSLFHLKYRRFRGHVVLDAIRLHA
jgi:site-specific DNA recombinase